MRELKEVKLYNPELKPIGQIQSRIKEVQLEMKEIQAKIEEIQPVREAPRKIEKAKAKIEEIQPNVMLMQDQLREIQGQIQQIEKMRFTTTKRKHAQIKKTELQIEKLQIQLKRIQSETKEMQPQEEEAGVQTQQRFSSRRLNINYGNSLFRILMWRDMLVQLREKKPILGFTFGKPFRSKSIEIINQAYGEWSRDGWITAHNSYLEILYRSGLVGILFIIAIFAILFKMIKKSIQLHSLNGVLLCGILINWLVAANFLVILELPYNAIPFWSLFGMTFAYLNNLKKNKIYKVLRRSL